MKLKGESIKSKVQTELESQLRDLDSKIEELSKERGEISVRLNTLRYGFDVGDEVTWEVGNTIAEGTVTSVGDFCGNAVLHVTRRLKNGKTKHTTVYHWSNPVITKKGQA